MVVDEIGREDSPQMAHAEDDHVVEAIAADRADQALDERVLPGRAWRAQDFLEAHACEPVAEGGAVDPVAVAQQVPRRAGFGERLDDLLGGPGGGRMLRHVEVQDTSAVVRQYDEDVEHAKGRGRDREEVDGGERTDVIGQEGAPCLRRRLARQAWHQARDLAFGDPDAELYQLAMDARGAPQRVGLRQLADEVARAAIDGWAPGCSARTPGPDVAESRAVPAHDGSWLDDDEDVAPAGPRTREPDPEEPVGPVERRTRAAAPKNDQLLAES